MVAADVIILFDDGSPSPIWPDPPTRAQILGGTTRLQGVTVQTEAYGSLLAFGPEINMLNLPGDRAAYYAAQQAAGTTVLCIGWAGFTYTSGDGFTYPVPGPGYRWVEDLPGFCDRLAEAIQAGFTGLLITLPGDGHTGVDDNPFGYQWLMANIGKLVAAMKAYPGHDLTRYVVFSPGFDGVIWNWTSDEVIAYGQLMRQLMPDSFLALEYGAGILGPFGEGKDQYDGPMKIFDLFLQEFASPPWSNMDQMWQIGARMLGPKYVRPPDQPPYDDPGSPFAAGSGGDYLSGGTPRGPYYTSAWEAFTYQWVRGQCTLDQINQWRAYITTMGYPVCG